jgi:hypothetical protein
MVDMGSVFASSLLDFQERMVREVTALMESGGMDSIDAVVHWAEGNDIDVSDLGSHVPYVLKEILEKDASRRRLLKDNG